MASKHIRDFRAEYARRIALAKERARAYGLQFTRSQARGHARTAKGEVPVSIFKRNKVIRAETQAVDRRVNKALGFVRDGLSVTAAAKKVGMSPATLRRIGTARGALEKTGATKGPRYKISSRWKVLIATPRGLLYDAVPVDRPTCSRMAHYWNAVRDAVRQGSSVPLHPLKGVSVRDLYGNSYRLCTNLSTIMRIIDVAGLEDEAVEKESRRRFIYSA